MSVVLRDLTEDDIEVLYAHQADPEASAMAAFPSRDRQAFEAHVRERVLGNESAVKKAIVVDGVVAGNIGSWTEEGRWLISYWIGHEFWGRGVATEALGQFVNLVATRPLHAYVAEHNLGSIKVLERCGFKPVWKGEAMPFEGRPVQDILYKLA